MKRPAWTSKLLASAIAAACSIVAAEAAYNWAMTERFGLLVGPTEALTFSAATLVASAIASSVLLMVLYLVARFRPLPRWIATVLGGTLFWIVPSVLVRNPAAGLLTLPAGVVAGHLLSMPASRGMSQSAKVALACGPLLWLALFARSAVDAMQESRSAHTLTSGSPLGGSVLGGVMFRSELWLFNQGGKMVSFRTSDWRPTVRANTGFAGIAASGSVLWALSAPAFDWRADHQPAARFRLAARTDGGWTYSAWQDYAVDERPLALALSLQGPVVLGPKRLYILPKAPGSAIVRALSQRIDASGQFTTAVIGRDTLYVGINRGEFGGGALRISLATGKVEPVEHRDSHQLCSGPLNAGCDPVTDLLPDEERPGCVFASIGLAHMMWTGRVVRICQARVETVFEAKVLPVGVRIERFLSSRAPRFPPQTEPVFALARAPNGFWAVTPRAIYQWRRGSVERQPFPEMKQVHGLAVSTAVPGLIAVSTDANAAYSLSGSTPLIYAQSTSRRSP